MHDVIIQIQQRSGKYSEEDITRAALNAFQRLGMNDQDAYLIRAHRPAGFVKDIPKITENVVPLDTPTEPVKPPVVKKAVPQPRKFSRAHKPVQPAPESKTEISDELFDKLGV